MAARTRRGEVSGARARQTRFAGYSGKPAWLKLGIAPESRVLVRHAPDDYARLVGLDPGALTTVGARAAFDIAHVFATSARTLRREIESLARRLPANGVIWASWPKKSAGVATDVTGDTVRAVALPLGLVDIKVCAVDDTWSGLKLVWRRQKRVGRD
jgi:hypothetical protein